MADFRRWLTALAVLALFAGLASAQVSGGGGGTALSCTASVVAPPQLRQEGLTELVGDIILVCSGGNTSATTSALSTVNITVSFAVNVTSRLLGNGLSEAMLIIDEPGSGLTSATGSIGGVGTGPSAPQTVCAGQLASSSTNLVGAGNGGCQQFAFNATASNGASIQVMSSTQGQYTAPANMYLGAVSGNQVIFNGIPVLAPGTTSATRYYRITNVRINAAGLTAGLAGTTPVTASIAVSPTNLPIASPLVTAGFVQKGLTTSFGNNANSAAGNVVNFNQCNSQTLAAVGTLRFTELFGTAFKTRVAPNGSVPYNGQAGAGVLQNVPGTIYNSESGFVNPNIAVGNATVGLADFGTRLKAVFTVPSNIRVFVSTTNLSGNGAITTNVVPAPGITSTNAYAVLINGETTADSAAGVPPTLTATGTAPSGMPIVEITPSGGGGTGTAVWEVINTNPAQLETFVFGVWISYTANTPSNLPTPGVNGTVAMSFAPTSTVAVASTGPVPRFQDTSTPSNIVIVNICQTYLLFPFVSNNATVGLDTGIAVANTSSDPLGTGTQTGVCAAFFYGDNAPATKNDYFGGAIAPGKLGLHVLSSDAPGFQGYMIIRCDFQWAHGFAFISDIGLRNYAMGYLALVLQNGPLSRGTSAESLNN